MGEHKPLFDPGALVPRRSQSPRDASLARLPIHGDPSSAGSLKTVGRVDTGSSIPQAAQAKRRSTEPLTLSLPVSLVRKGRVLAAVKGMTISRLIAELLQRAIELELPTLLATLDAEEGGDQ
jgi:hypothetical protein